MKRRTFIKWCISLAGASPVLKSVIPANPRHTITEITVEGSGEQLRGVKEPLTYYDRLNDKRYFKGDEELTYNEYVRSKQEALKQHRRDIERAILHGTKSS